MTKIIGCSMMIIVILYSAAAFAEGPYKSEEIVLDVIAARPLGLATLAIGTAFFIVSLPFAVISGSTDVTAKALLADPFNYTFTRPLGDFNNSAPYTAGQNNKDKNIPE